jgi:hypothetical protein
MLDMYSGKDHDRDYVQLDQEFVDGTTCVAFPSPRLPYVKAKMMVGAHVGTRFEYASAR